MMPARKNIIIVRGDDFEEPFRIRSKVWDEVNLVWVPGDYIDLTGYVGRSQIRDSPDGQLFGTMLVDIDSDQVMNKGLGRIRMSSPMTALLEHTECVYDVEFVTVDGKTKTFFGGDVKVKKDVTHG